MSSCSTCGNRGYLCRQCKMEELEDRIGVPSDHDTDRWILGETWHASIAFDGGVHTCACAETVTTPVNWVSEDLRYVDSDAPICPDCVAALEEVGDPRLETVPDGGFERASQLPADGGSVHPSKQTIVPDSDRKRSESL